MKPAALCRALTLALTPALALGAAPLAAEAFKYVAFGDSVTAGYEDEVALQGYPAKLVSLLAAEGRSVQIKKSGVGGETTGQGLTRLDGVLAQESPQVLLLMEGTNDVFSKFISVETAAFNLRQMAAKATAAGVDTVHLTIIPMKAPGANSPHIKNGQAAGLADLVEQTALTDDHWLVDLFDIWTAINDHYFKFYYQDLSDPDPDPVGHPRNVGFQRMAGDISNVLLDPLPGAATPTTPAAAADVCTATPAFGWQEAAGATFYRLRITDAGGGEAYSKWHKAAPSCAGGDCSLVPIDPLPGSGQYNWTILPRNPAGWGTESAPRAFTYWDSSPGQPDPGSPGGPTFDIDPAFVWGHVPCAVDYRLEVWIDGGASLHDASYSTATACSEGLCMVQPMLGLPPGSYLWRLTASNPLGDGPASAERAFEVRNCPAQRDLTVGPGQLAIGAHYEACGTVTVTGFEILDGGDATFHGGEAVTFDDGSSIAAGGQISVFVD